MNRNKKTSNETGSCEYSLSRLKVKALLYSCLIIVALLTVFQHNASGRDVVYWTGGTGEWDNDGNDGYHWVCDEKIVGRHNSPSKNDIAHIKNDGFVKARPGPYWDASYRVHRLILGDEKTYGALWIAKSDLLVGEDIVLGPEYSSGEENYGFIRMDPGSFIKAENIYAGLRGPGQIFVNGGEIETDNMTVGVHSKANGYVHLSGHEELAEIDCKKTAVIGDSGKGEVFVSQGGSSRRTV